MKISSRRISQFVILLSVFIGLSTYAADKTQLQKVIIEELTWMDQSKTQQQQDKIQELARTKLGSSFHGSWDDIALLQRLIDQKVVAKDDSYLQEAMGVMVGNLMRADFPSHLEWKIYKDSLGRSRALCVRKTQECLFPVTILSRRIQLDAETNVAKVYDDAINEIAFVLPQMPYGGGLLHQLKR